MSGRVRETEQRQNAVVLLSFILLTTGVALYDLYLLVTLSAP